MPGFRRRFSSVAEVAATLKPSYPVYCLRPRVLEDGARYFQRIFPGTVLYAVKCNPHPYVLDALYGAGIRHFDTASLPEIALIADRWDDVQCHFMHPVKARAVINNAWEVYGVTEFVVDHPVETTKVLEETEQGHGCTILVRIKTPHSEGTLFHLSDKFGCEPDEAPALLQRIAAAGCKTGVAFHVGSQCLRPDAYEIALELVGQVLERADIMPACVDVGGGFPSDYPNLRMPPLEEYMEAIGRGLNKLGLPDETRIYAEPGRALVAKGCSLLTQVQLRKGRQLYLNDGLYGSLSEMALVDIRMPVRLIRLGGESPSKETMAFTLNGPTCDSLDVLPGTFELPADVTEGDWVEVDQIGAYSNALASRFNGFFPETFVEVDDTPPRTEPEPVMVVERA